MKRMSPFNLLLAVALILGSCKEKEPIHHTVFRLGYKTGKISTGPLDNTGFIFKINDSLPPVFLTAHHVVAGYARDKYYQWSQLKEKVRNAWIWSVHDNDYQLKLGENVPIRGARAAALDVAVFRVEEGETLGWLRPSPTPARIGDTVRLFSKLLHYDTSALVIPSRVIYVTDSILVHELLLPKLIKLGGSSGAPVLNENGELIACTWGSLTIRDQEIKNQLGKDFPLIHEIDVEIGKTYGIGIPAALVNQAVFRAVVVKE